MMGRESADQVVAHVIATVLRPELPLRVDTEDVAEDILDALNNAGLFVCADNEPPPWMRPAKPDEIHVAANNKGVFAPTVVGGPLPLYVIDPDYEG